MKNDSYKNINDEGTISGLEVRFSKLEDGTYLRKWLNDPLIIDFFPIQTEREIEDAVNFWLSFCRYNSSLTAILNGKVCGVATLVLMPYQKIAHHALISIIVEKECRNKGVGTFLLNNLFHLAKTRFNLEVLYLEVYEGNPAISLYLRFGFKETGVQHRFIKTENGYLSKIIMERDL